MAPACASPSAARTCLVEGGLAMQFVRSFPHLTSDHHDVLEFGLGLGWHVIQGSDHNTPRPSMLLLLLLLFLPLATSAI